MVRYFDSFSCFPVGDDYFGSLQTFPQGSDGSLDEVVLSPKGFYVGNDFGFMSIAMGDDPGGVARGAGVGHHGRFWSAAARLDVVLDKVPLFGSEVTT